MRHSIERFLVWFFFLTMISSVVHGDVLLEEGFEGSGSIPTGWTTNLISGAASWSISAGGMNGVPAAAHGGSNNARLYIGNTDDNKTELISPTFDTTGYTNIRLTVWHAQPLWFSDQDELKVFYSLNGGADWIELAYYTADATDWTLRRLDIPTPSANSCVKFEGNAKYGHGVCLDDIQVSGIPNTYSEFSVSATDAEASEAGTDPGTWTITRTGNTTGSLEVNFTLSGTATNGSDYNVDATSPLSFSAGETSKVVTLTPVDDSVQAEGDEVATLTLTSGTGYAIDVASADISIYDDEGFGLNILIIGSTNSFSEGGEHNVVHEKPFDPTGIANHLREIIDQDPAISNAVNVVCETVFKTKPKLDNTSIIEHCYSLPQHYFWPEGKTNRLENLRGEAGTKWDYIVLCGDPYIMANFPGMFAEGVELIREEASKSTNPVPPEVILLGQWPENSSAFSADDFNEIVHRVGGSAGLTVVPAGKVWDTYTSQDTDAAHPTPRGAYLAAASIYSKLYDRSAKTSNYTYPSDGDNIADHALSEVQSIAGAPQYSGLYGGTNTFTMKYVNKRRVAYKQTGTSTEQGIYEALHRLDDFHSITFYIEGYSDPGGTRWDFNYGRGNDAWEDEKDYEVNTNLYDRSYGFPMHYYTKAWAPYTMPYGIDKHYSGGAYDDGTDLGIAYNMVRPNTRETGLPEGHDVRAIPIRLLCAKIDKAYPGFQPLIDDNHMGPYLNNATAAFMYTLLSGRCPVEDEPATYGSTEWMHWIGYKVGYETAWQMAHLTTRSPGLRVLPSSRHSRAVSTVAQETMTVRFMNPPQSNVTVNVTISDPSVATVSPSSLVFTPSNYDTVQEVTVTGLSITPDVADFDVVFSTSSDDEVYDGLSDSWLYSTLKTTTETDLIAGFDGNNTAIGSTLSEPCRSPVVIEAGIHATLSTSDSMSKAFQWTAAGQWSPGTWGTLMVAPPPITNNQTTVATLGGPATLNFVIDNSAGTQSVELVTFHFSAQRDSADTALDMTIAYASGDLAGSSGVQTLVNDIGVNHAYDFDLASILTDNTLGPGESATITFTQASTNTSRLKLDDIAISGNVIPPAPAIYYTVEYLAAANGSISGSATQTVQHSTSGTAVEAVGDAGYRFDQWSDGSAQNPRIDVNVTNDITVTASFVLDPIGVANSGTTPSNTTSAVLSGQLTGGTTASAWICWGEADAGTGSTGDWAHVELAGAVTEAMPFSVVADSVTTNVTYWYRCYVSNGSGTAWSDSPSPFSGATLSVSIGSGEPVLLGGFDGNQTQNGSGSSGVRELVGGKQSASMVGAVATRIWTDQITEKELQWGVNSISTTDGQWGTSIFTPAASTGNEPWVLTQAAASWINIEVSNTGASDIALSKFHLSARRTSTDASTTLTVSLQENGSFADPVVLLGKDLDDALGVSQDIDITAHTVNTWGDYEFAFSNMLSDVVLAPTETATFRIANNVATARLYIDNIAISGGASVSGGVIANDSPTNVTDTSAVLRGNLNASGTNYAVYVHWGTADGGTNLGNWAASSYLDTFDGVATNLDVTVSGLFRGQTYYYTFRGSNDAGNVWASPSWQFATPAGGVLTTNHLIPYTWIEDTATNLVTDHESDIMNDPDGDGFSTWQEYWCGTDPNAPDSHLKIDAVRFDGTTVELEWKGAQIRDGIPPIAVLSTTNLLSGPWVKVGERSPSNGTNLWSAISSPQQLYFRIAVTNTP